jgi:hypothetical protein
VFVVFLALLVIGQLDVPRNVTMIKVQTGCLRAHGSRRVANQLGIVVTKRLSI